MSAGSPAAGPDARVLLLGGIDPCGGAGITADCRVLAWHGAWGLPVPVVMTAQNRHGLQAIDAVQPAVWQRALESAVADGPVHAIKIGLLADAAQVAAVATALAAIARTAPLVVDPVLSASAGGFEHRAAVVAAYAQHLLPLAAVLTPNRPELAAFGGDPPALLARGCGAVVVKGGHGDGERVVDALHTPAGVRTWTHARRPVGAVHGTGCAFASALAAGLALGELLPVAVARATEFLADCLEAMGAPATDARPRPLALPRRTSPR